MGMFKKPKVPAAPDPPPPAPTAPTGVDSSKRSFFSPTSALGGTFLTGGQNNTGVLKSKTSGLAKTLGGGGG